MCSKPLRNIDQLTLDIPFSRPDVFKHSFFVRICRLLNELPLTIRESNTLLAFREKLMAFYYDKFYVTFFKFYSVFYLTISLFIIMILLTIECTYFYNVVNYFSIFIIIGGLFLRSLVFCFKSTSALLL